jgi:ABC-type multidrug transport system fused ATPase/permease subunit
MMEMFGIFSLFTGAAIVLTWLIRHLLAHRRWLRATKIQMDIHNRLMERLSSSEDVRHYLQSAATTHLLADVPPMLEAGRAGSPTGRILLAVQVGVVLVCAGSGLLLTKNLLRATGEAADVMVFVGVLALAIGIGFALASLASFVVSRRLGLLGSPAPSPTEPA